MGGIYSIVAITSLYVHAFYFTRRVSGIGNHILVVRIVSVDRTYVKYCTQQGYM